MPDMLDMGIWANEALRLFEDSTYLTKRVHRSFEMEVANERDIVSIIRPHGNGRTSAQLGDRLWCSFVVQDRDFSRSFNVIAHTYLQPAMRALTHAADQSILAYLWNSIDDYMPQLPKLTRQNALENVTRASEILDNHGVPTRAGGRSITLDIEGETELLRGNAFEELRTLNLAPGYTVFDNEAARGVSFIFHRDAVAFVTRPLARVVTPDVRSLVAHYNDISLRMTMNYDIRSCGVRVTVELLSGVTILKPNWIVALGGGVE